MSTIQGQAEKEDCANAPTLDPPGLPNAETGEVPGEKELKKFINAIASHFRAALADTERLDWLDECNRRLNESCGTVYGWRVILSHNVTRLMLESPYVREFAGVDLNDQEPSGKLSCREAIDAARGLSKKGDQSPSESVSPLKVEEEKE